MLMNPGLLDALEVGAEMLQASEQNWDVKFTRGPKRGKSAAWLQILTDESCGQLSVWDSGECDLELLASDGRQLLCSTHVVEGPRDVDHYLENLVAQCRQRAR